jgi:cytochrome bd-type quinol oxidase subunit 2
MDIIYKVLVLLHLIGMAALFGGFFVQMSAKEKVINKAMFHGSLTQLVTGILMVGLIESGSVDEEIDMNKISLKLLIAFIITVMVFMNRKKAVVKTSNWAIIGLLTLVNMAIAVFV